MMTKGTDARTIVTLMAFATGIALVGHLVDAASGAPTTRTGTSPVGDAQILLGGTAATVLLTLLSMAGEPGSKLGKGLALITLMGSTLYYGTPVFTSLDRLTGRKATTSTTTTTKKGTTT